MHCMHYVRNSDIVIAVATRAARTRVAVHACRGSTRPGPGTPAWRLQVKAGSHTNSWAESPRGIADSQHAEIDEATYVPHR